jgi:hypothetical protein
VPTDSQLASQLVSLLWQRQGALRHELVHVERLTSLLTPGAVRADVRSYAFDWGHMLCDGILPLVVVRPANASDVAHAVAYASTHRLAISVRSGGHSYTCESIRAGSIHVDLRSLRSLAFQPPAPGQKTGEATFGTGLRFADLLHELPPERYMYSHGECHGVGVGGFYLHGGVHRSLTPYVGLGNATLLRMQARAAPTRAAHSRRAHSRRAHSRRAHSRRPKLPSIAGSKMPCPHGMGHVALATCDRHAVR